MTKGHKNDGAGTAVEANRPTPYRNLLEIYRNQDAWFTAYELAFGRIRMNDTTRPGLKASIQALDHLWSIVTGGAAAVAEWSLQRRHKATGNVRQERTKMDPTTSRSGRRRNRRSTVSGRGVTVSALFLASGVERAWGRKATVHEKGMAVIEAYARLTKQREQISPVIMTKLLGFTKKLCRRTASHDMQLPGAAFKACTDHSSRHGGQVAAVQEWGCSDGLRPLNTWKAAMLLIARRRYNLLMNVARACQRLDRVVIKSHGHVSSQTIRTNSSSLLTRVLMIEATSDLDSAAWTAVWNGGDVWSDNRNIWDDDIGDTASESWLYDGSTGLYYDPTLIVEPTPHPGMADLSSSIRLLSELGLATHPAVALEPDASGTIDPGEEWLTPQAAYRRLGLYLKGHLWAIAQARPADTLTSNVLLDPEVSRRAPDRVDVNVLKNSPLAIAHEACRKTALHSAANPSKVILRNFQNPVGKGRLATVHEPHVVLAAKAVTAWLTPRLKHVRTNKDILRNQTVELHPSGSNPLAYSADWKKGTDEISTETAGRVMLAALEATGAPQWLMDAVPGIVGNMILYAEAPSEDLKGVFPLCSYEGDVDLHRAALLAHRGGQPLTCGASMGLGPSWFVMSIMNDFAASEAGALAGTFSVNGDDLIGYWSQKRALRYEAMLRRIHIVPNVKKSFLGAQGVFCERLMHIHRDRDTLIGRPSYRLGEACGVRSIDGQRGFAVVDTLADIAAGRTPDGYQRTHRLVRSLARRTVFKTALAGPKTVPGRVEHGGCGNGIATDETLRNYLLHGATNVTTIRHTIESEGVTRIRAEKLRKLITECASIDVEGGVRVQEVAAELSTLDNHMLDVVHKDWRERLLLKPYDVRDVVRRHVGTKMATDRCKTSALTMLMSDVPPETARTNVWRWSKATRRRAAHLVRAKKFGQAIGYLSSHTIKVAAPEGDSLFPPHLQRIAGKKVPTGACTHRT